MRLTLDEIRRLRTGPELDQAIRESIDIPWYILGSPSTDWTAASRVLARLPTHIGKQPIVWQYWANHPEGMATIVALYDHHRGTIARMFGSETFPRAVCLAYLHMQLEEEEHVANQEAAH